MFLSRWRTSYVGRGWGLPSDAPRRLARLRRRKVIVPVPGKSLAGLLSSGGVQLRCDCVLRTGAQRM